MMRPSGIHLSHKHQLLVLGVCPQPALALFAQLISLSKNLVKADARSANGRFANRL